MNCLEGARVLDLFAGTGALGIEALSRGAELAIFVEAQRKTALQLQDNLSDLGLNQAASVVCAAVWEYLSSEDNPAFTLVFADPPYGAIKGDRLLCAIVASDAVAAGTTIVIEGELDMKTVDISGATEIAERRGWHLLERKLVSRGDTCLGYYALEKAAE